MKIKVKKGDTVAVIAGDSKGQQGKILSIDIQKNRAIVEGINIASKHTKPNAKSPQGGIVKKEAYIHISNLMLVDASGNSTRVGRRLNAEGKIERYSKNTEEVIK
jgi:large subunit ribosomal protein L24